MVSRPDRRTILRHQQSASHLSRWLEDLRHDLGLAIRQIRRSPGFAALIVITLGVGIGANVTMAGAIDRLLLRAPAHVRDPERIVRLLFVSRNPLGRTRVGAKTNYPAMQDQEREVTAFEATAAYSRMSVSFGEGSDAVRIRASLVSPSFFRVFRVTPTVGRLFTPTDGSPSAGVPVAVLGHAFWQVHFARDRGVVGRSVRIGTLTYTVVGVTPSGFKGVESQEPEVWLPMTVDAARVATFPLSLTDRGSTWLSIVARLRRGASRACAPFTIRSTG